MDEAEYIPVTVKVNGLAVRATIEPRMLLVEFIREVAGLTGTHIGCDTSYCGACTVLLDGHSVKSCTLLAVQAAGRDVRTVEGLEAKNSLHALQTCFGEYHALQCGFCTPGFLMSAVSLLAQTPDPDEKTIKKRLAGNVCRCTGYLPIVQAVQAAAVKLRETENENQSK
jgi:carbon-monoxide dehydrogenase small subunit